MLCFVFDVDALDALDALSLTWISPWWQERSPEDGLELDVEGYGLAWDVTGASRVDCRW